MQLPLQLPEDLPAHHQGLLSTLRHAVLQLGKRDKRFLQIERQIGSMYAER